MREKGWNVTPPQEEFRISALPLQVQHLGVRFSDVQVALTFAWHYYLACMAKKGRKKALQQSAKAIYDRKASRKHAARGRPGRPDGGAAAVVGGTSK